MSYDYLDARRPEFERFGLQQIYFPPITNILPEDGDARVRRSGSASTRR